LAALAFATGFAIGIDLEQLRPVADMQEIADRYFCTEEAAELLPLPAPERDRAFFACWTRKEAFLKATGEGFQCPLSSFRVTALPNVDARLMHIGGDSSAAEKWTLHDLQLAPGFAAALAYHAPPRSLSLFRLTDLSELPPR
jgi:4'-phosphopantetheinyl transferase